ncbi:hypothetical protein [Anaerovibrio sp. RM50]|uniref:hypothetical protein n=1 Tax=Anaerovibrio sp. RM50 TaxID=1200557 RepID=UPI0012EBA585|nr:hypothetical protein [Anaerovibrio sp. RM50]
MTFQQEAMEFEARGELRMAIQTVKNVMSKNPQKDVNAVMDDLCYEGELREQIIKHIVQ